MVCPVASQFMNTVQGKIYAYAQLADISNFLFPCAYTFNNEWHVCNTYNASQMSYLYSLFVPFTQSILCNMWIHCVVCTSHLYIRMCVVYRDWHGQMLIGAMFHAVQVFVQCVWGLTLIQLAIEGAQICDTLHVLWALCSWRCSMSHLAVNMYRFLWLLRFLDIIEVISCKAERR